VSGDGFFDPGVKDVGGRRSGLPGEDLSVVEDLSCTNP
jgi:hypothetical protein